MKKNLKLFMLSVLTVALLFPGIALGSLDNQGKEFIMTFLPNYRADSDKELHLTSDVATTVTIEYPVSSPTFTTSVGVAPGNITIVSLPDTASQWTPGSVENRAVRAFSDDEFVCYMINRSPATSDAALALPVDTMNTDYIVATYNSASSHHVAEFAFVAAYDNTTVNVTPTIGPAYSVSLNRGQGYLHQQHPGDLTGTIITSDKPIGMTNGNKCQNIDEGACDHIFEVAPPVQAWGDYIPVANIPETSLGTRYKIVASTDNTNVSIDGVIGATINRGEFYLTDRLPGDHIIEGDNPILAYQFMTNRLGSGGNPIGDPSMGLMIPSAQYKSTYTFSTVGGSQFAENNVTIIAQESDIDTITLDGVAVGASNFTQIGSTSFYVARPYLTDGVHTTSSNSPHGITVEGFNSYDSYLYPGGALFQFINPVGDANPPECSFDVGTGTGTAADNRPSEDANGNGILDPGEDLNGDGLIDEDTGIFLVELGEGAVNLTLTVDPFVPGDGIVSYSVALTDSGLGDGSGVIIVTDGAGNTCEIPVEILSNQAPEAVIAPITDAAIPLPVTLKVTPQTLNMERLGKWVKAHVCGDIENTPQQITITLDGSGSFDSDNDPIVTYDWTLTGPEGEIDVDDVAVTDVVLPAGSYDLTLVVNDGTVDSDTATTSFTLTDQTLSDLSAANPSDFTLNGVPASEVKGDDDCLVISFDDNAIAAEVEVGLEVKMTLSGPAAGEDYIDVIQDKENGNGNGKSDLKGKGK